MELHGVGSSPAYWNIAQWSNYAHRVLPEVYARSKENAQLCVQVYDTIRRLQLRKDLQAGTVGQDEMLRFFNAVHPQVFEQATVVARHLIWARQGKDKLIGVSTTAEAYDTAMQKKQSESEEKQRKKEENDQKERALRTLLQEQERTINELKGRKGDPKGKASKDKWNFGDFGKKGKW